MSNQAFKRLYAQALELQQKGDLSGFPPLIERGIKEGLDQEEIMMLGSLAEGAFQFPNMNATP